MKVAFGIAPVIKGSIIIGADDALYIGNPGDDGTWRITRDGNNFHVECREGGIWIPKTITTP